MRIALTFLLMMVLMVACDTPVRDSAETTTADISNRKENIVAQSQATHFFSDTAAADTFKLKLYGDSLLTSKAVLQIISNTGEVLYEDTFDANFLFDYNLQANATPQEKEAFIRDRVANFFASENFVQPAIPADQQFDPNYAKEGAWQAIKADADAVGFHYQLGKEDGRWLAYSKKQDKVVLYFNCC